MSHIVTKSIKAPKSGSIKAPNEHQPKAVTLYHALPIGIIHNLRNENYDEQVPEK